MKYFRDPYSSWTKILHQFDVAYEKYIQQQFTVYRGILGPKPKPSFFDGVIGGMPKTQLFQVCFPCYLAFVAATGCGPTRVQSRLVVRVQRAWWMGWIKHRDPEFFP